MLNQINQMIMPNWINTNKFKFSTEKILKDSLYYPCCQFDGDPVKYFMGNVYSFIYVDYGISKNDLKNEIKNNGFRGYDIIHQQEITEKELIPNGWNIKIYPESNEEKEKIKSINIEKPFCEWIIFERQANRDDLYNPKRFSLLYLCADGSAAYQALYLSNNIKPKIVAIIQPGTGFGNNWTDFTGRNNIFARSVLYDNLKFAPEYIINGGHGIEEFNNNCIWQEYSKKIVVLSKSFGGFLVLWGKT